MRLEKRIVFAGKGTGLRPHELFAQRGKRIAGGIEGEVFETDVFLSKGLRTKRARMVEKAFFDKTRQPEHELAVKAILNARLGGEKTPEDMAKEISFLKKIGCKTIPTYRLAVDEKGKQTIIMTDLNKLGRQAVGFFAPDVFRKMTRLANYEEMKRTILENTIRAAEHGHLLYTDSWLLVVRHTPKGTTAEPFIADVGFCGAAGKQVIEKNLLTLARTFALAEKGGPELEILTSMLERL